MRRVLGFASRITGVFNRSRRDHELADEIESHVQMHIADNVRKGLSEKEARRLALINLGGKVSLTEEYRDRRGLPLIDTIASDLRYAFRALRRAPGITAIAVLTAALGIGATTAIFSVVYSVLLQGLPFPQPERLVQLWESRPEKGPVFAQTAFGLANFWDVQARNRTFENIGALGYGNGNLTGHGEPITVSTGAGSAGFFRALGVKPTLGRLLEDGDDQPGHDNHLALLQNRFWRLQFGGRSDVVGQNVQIDGVTYIVVGVLPPGEPWLNSADVFVPLVYDPKANRGSFEYAVVGRIKPGVNLDQARADLQSVAEGLAADYPDPDKEMGIIMTPSSTWVASDNLRRALWVLLGAVAFLLLIASINLTNLLLVRATGRSREITLRFALGAARRRIVTMLLGESLVLALFGGGLGLLLALFIVRGLASIDPNAVPRIREAGLNWWVLAFAFGTALVTGILCGLAPAFRSQDRDLAISLREGDRSHAGSQTQNRLRSALITLEVALSLILLVGAGLLVRSFQRLLNVDRGFQSDSRLVFSVNLPSSYQAPQIKEFTTAFLARAQSEGIVSAGAVSSRPLVGIDPGMGIGAADQPDMQGGAIPWAGWRYVTPEYFKAAGIPLISGRTFDDADKPRDLRVIISRRLAELLWPGQNPIGRKAVLWKGQGGPEAEVIGVVADQRERGLDVAPTLTVYLPFLGSGFNQATYLIHTPIDPMKALPSLRATVAEIDPNVPISDVQTMD
ncbi:MAG TPA: ABC transporter permease, partial [Blastocatellia bacterium]